MKDLDLPHRERHNRFRRDALTPPSILKTRADAVGVEVGHDLSLPGAEGAAEPGDFGNGAGVEAVQDLDRDLAAFGRYCVVDGAELFVARQARSTSPERVAGVEAAADLGLLALGEVFQAAEEPADPIQRSSPTPNK